jgi:5-methylcytosine-specific restriction endonuclease McrA
MECKRCGKQLTGKQTVYCSEHCCTLYLKTLYRKRNQNKINAYNRKYRKLGITHHPIIDKKYLICAKCGSTDKIEICHVKPRKYGGKNLYNVVFFCHLHHSHFDKALKRFWYI